MVGLSITDPSNQPKPSDILNAQKTESSAKRVSTAVPAAVAAAAIASAARRVAPHADGPARNSLINYLSSETVTLSDLHRLTTDRDLCEAIKAAGVSIHHKDVVFLEHKVNGKTKGHPRKPAKSYIGFTPRRKVQPSYVTGQNPPGRPASAGPPRPLTNLGLPANFATNAHGGINFNRLRPHNRQAVQQALGIGKAGRAAQGYNAMPPSTSPVPYETWGHHEWDEYQHHPYIHAPPDASYAAYPGYDSGYY